MNSYDSISNLKKNMSCPSRCNPPRCIPVQFQEERHAFNVNNMEYGGINPINTSSMRENFSERMRLLFELETEGKGVSAGGGEYVFPIYKTYKNHYIHQKPSDYGYQKMKDAYGSRNGGTCKIHYEDY